MRELQEFIDNLCLSYPEIKAVVLVSLLDGLRLHHPTYEPLSRLAENSLEELETIALNSPSNPVQYLVYSAGEDLLQIHLVERQVYFFVLQARRPQTDLSWINRSNREIAKLQTMLHSLRD